MAFSDAVDSARIRIRLAALAAVSVWVVCCSSAETQPPVGSSNGTGGGSTSGDSGGATTTSKSSGGGGEAPANTGSAIVVIHADPGWAGPDNWAKLSALANKTKQAGHRLTIEMSADWGMYATGEHPMYPYDPASACTGDVAKPCRLETVKSWIEAGHQIGFHHHDCSHFSADGYFSTQLATHPDCKKTKPAKGSVQEAFAKVSAIETWLLQNGVAASPATLVNTAGQGPNDDTSFDSDGDGQGADPMGDFRSWEWQPQAVFSTSPIEPTLHPGATFLHTIRCSQASADGGKSKFELPDLGYQQIAVGSFSKNAKLERLEADLATFASLDDPADYVVGLVFHAREYDEASKSNPSSDKVSDLVYIDRFFDALAAAGFTARRVSEVLATKSCP